MAVLMVAMLAFGGTYAYFTAKSNDVAGSVKVGTVEIKVGATAKLNTVATYAVPGSTIYNEESVAFTNASTVNMFVFAEVSAKVGTDILYVRTAANTYSPILTSALGSTVDTTAWKSTGLPDGVYGYYVAAPAADEDTGVVTPATVKPFIFDVTLSDKIEEEHNQNAGAETVSIVTNVYKKKADATGTTDNDFEKITALEGQTINVTVTFKAIQALHEGSEFEMADAYSTLNPNQD